MSETAKQPREAPARIKALLRIEVDGMRIEPGKTAEIRAELLPELLACGAAEELPAKPGKGG
jgi:hypothetical protein